MQKLWEKTINTIFQKAGLEVKRLDKKKNRMSLRGALLHIKRLGFYPKTVIDLGAAFGSWTRNCVQVFPRARYFLIDPLGEYRNSLQAAVSGIKKAKYFKVATGSENKTATINVHNDLVGSSFFREQEGASADGTPRKVEMKRLDDIVAEQGVLGPFLIKIDVQGAELEVLTGAEKTLTSTEYVILETTLFCSMIGSRGIYDVLKFMKERGFVFYDIISCLYRPLDGALCQIDTAFVKEDSLFRKDHRYCTRRQRIVQDKRFRKKNKKRLI